MRHPYGTTVTVIRQSPGGVDAYGDPVASTMTRSAVADCAIAPRYSTEPSVRDRQGVVVGLTLYAPAGSDILRTDIVDVDGVEYLVEGVPASWVSPFTGWAPGLEVSLRRAEG